MSSVHLHLLVNHFPIIGSLIGFLILVSGFIFKNSIIKRVALGVFILSSLSTFPVYKSGEASEEVIEKMNIPNSHNLIEEHEENAQRLGTILNLIGLLSIVSLYLDIKNKSIANYLILGIAFLSLVSIFFAFNTGRSGGEIIHQEIRSTK